MISSTGHHHQLPVHIIYVTGAQNEEKAETAAKAELQKEMHVAVWSDAADSVTVDDPRN